MKAFAREFPLASWKARGLHHAVQRLMDGPWMRTKPTGHGKDVSPQGLYPIRRRMERVGELNVVKESMKHPRARHGDRLLRASKHAG